MNCVLVALALVLCLGQSAFADTINACVAKPNGKIRIVANTGMCKASETGLSWESSPPPSPAPFKLVGFTTATIGASGNLTAGVLEWTRTCAAEFTGARACKSDEVVFSPAPPTITNPDDQAWVMPVLVAPNTDVSGFQNFGNGCAAPNGTGLTVDGHGRYNNSDCTNAHRVACCAPAN